MQMHVIGCEYWNEIVKDRLYAHARFTRAAGDMKKIRIQHARFGTRKHRKPIFGEIGLSLTERVLSLYG